MLKHMWAALEVFGWLLVGEALAIGPWPLCAEAIILAILLRLMNRQVSRALS